MALANNLKKLKEDMALEIFNNPQKDILYELKILNLIFEILEEIVIKINRLFLVIFNKPLFVNHNPFYTNYNS
jgi:hypothetical protein